MLPTILTPRSSITTCSPMQLVPRIHHLTGLRQADMLCRMCLTRVEERSLASRDAADHYQACDQHSHVQLPWPKSTP